MKGTGTAYQVQKNDTLWDIAATHLGDPHAWPRIYAFNNQANVIAAGARRIENPDLIYAGSMLRLPIFQGIPTEVKHPTAVRPSAPRSLELEVPKIQMPINVAYELKGDTITLDYGTYIVRLRQKGKILITLGQKMPLTLAINGGVSAHSKQSADHAFGQLISQNSVSFDPSTKHIKFSNKLISSSNVKGAPKTAIGVEMSSASGMPVLKGEIVYDQIKGTLASNAFVAIDYRIEIEIEPKRPRVKPQPILVHQPSPLPSARRAPQTDWWDLAKKATVGAIVVAGVVTVAYGASVVLSGGTTGLGAPAYASAVTIILTTGTVAQIAVQ
ncbi:LysM peptidoglycan-binding domain-containing protein [Roseibium sp.]|uniref:LysM peptidoglycan-binding domain-containing protein n=1 Tax=Roseibium sp. TaxID=1936156 RepID=UPI003B514D23